MLNIAYCFDDNFNIQAMTSMYSFLENSKEKINFYVIHQTYSDENFIIDFIYQNIYPKI